MRNDTLRTIIALAVALMWVVAGVASVIQRDYRTLEITTPIMGIVTGFLFGYQLTINKTQRKENGS